MAWRRATHDEVPSEHIQLEAERPEDRVQGIGSAERFDRIAYAMRLLACVRPRMNVAVYESSERLHVSRGGRALRGQAWAIMGIPKDAARAQIVLAVAELAGMEHLPIVSQLLLASVDGQSD